VRFGFSTVTSSSRAAFKRLGSTLGRRARGSASHRCDGYRTEVLIAGNLPLRSGKR
jgi:hypothetical protein